MAWSPGVIGRHGDADLKSNVGSRWNCFETTHCAFNEHFLQGECNVGGVGGVLSSCIFIRCSGMQTETIRCGEY